MPSKTVGAAAAKAKAAKIMLVTWTHGRSGATLANVSSPPKDSELSFSLVIDNHSHYMGRMGMRLDELPFRTPAIVTGIDWSCLSGEDARRLRNLGFDEGVRIEALHGAPFGKDPLAIRIGRMMVALRRAQARAVSVETDAA